MLIIALAVSLIQSSDRLPFSAPPPPIMITPSPHRTPSVADNDPMSASNLSRLKSEVDSNPCDYFIQVIMDADQISRDQMSSAFELEEIMNGVVEIQEGESNRQELQPAVVGIANEGIKAVKRAEELAAFRLRLLALSANLCAS